MKNTLILQELLDINNNYNTNTNTDNINTKSTITNTNNKEQEQTPKEESEYQYGLDIIRFIAMIMVVLFHGLVLNYLYFTTIDTIILFISDVIFCITYSCNGLFMILTGYLKRNKKPSLSYFSKLINFIIEYIICYFVCAIFLKYYNNKKEEGYKEIIEGLFTFKEVSHVWFVKMYIGLFLLSPFLNILYDNIKDKKNKYILIIILIILYSLPYTYHEFGWRYYESGYCIMYYFIGCFVREYQPTLNRLYIIIIIIIISTLEALANVYSTHLTPHNFYNLGSVFIVTLIFIFFYQLKTKKKNYIIKVFRKITDCSFSFFLINYIFEEIFYYHLFNDKGYYTFMKRLPHILYVIPIIIISGLICSLITHNISVLIIKLIYYIIGCIKGCYRGNKKEILG